MPSSFHGVISPVLTEYLNSKANSVLDVGVGFGKWGMLFREYGDVFKGRYYPKDWTVHITGVEPFKDYHNPLYDFAYNKVEYLPIEDYLEKNPKAKFDFIYAGDVIEHLPKKKAQSIIEELKRRTKKQLVITIPLGDRWPQGEVFGNSRESHQSTWNTSDFNTASKKQELTNPAGKPIGIFTWVKIQPL